MKRVFRFIFKLLVVLLVLAGIVVVLFETQVAGKYMLDAVGNRFNVDLAAESVEIKLDGTLRLREFSARLLDEHEPFFQLRISKLAQAVPAS